MKRIKSLFIAALFALCMMFSACNLGGNGTSGNTGTLSTDSTELVIDSASVQKDTMIQCYAITKAGTQCERLVFPPDTYCFQHKKMYEKQ